MHTATTTCVDVCGFILASRILCFLGSVEFYGSNFFKLETRFLSFQLLSVHCPKTVKYHDRGQAYVAQRFSRNKYNDACLILCSYKCLSVTNTC